MSDTAFILILHDSPAEAEAIADSLRALGHACSVLDNVVDGASSLERRAPDVLVAKSHFGGKPVGIDLARQARRHHANMAIMIIAAAGEERAARTAARELGAAECLTMAGAEKISNAIASMAAKAVAAREHAVMGAQLDQTHTTEGIVAGSAKMRQILDRVRKLAASKLTVLVLGESGTGKELIARAIHVYSDRANRPFVPANCAGFAEGVLESELFGHVKGAFTGAFADRKGLFEEADGGTLFLDEVGDMPLAMQSKLLRALENGEIVRVGSNRPTHVDVRVVAATNKDLKELRDEGKFRQDLYYRLNQAMIILPPLRDRREDIPALAHHFLRTGNRRHGKSIGGFTPDAMRRLTRYAWPGNVRELESRVHEMMVLAEGSVLDVDDISDPAIRGSTEIVPVSATVPALGLTLRDMERLAIEAALRISEGNREKAAKQLGIPTRTLYRRLKEFGMG